jgi:hypothetical protein
VMAASSNVETCRRAVDSTGQSYSAWGTYNGANGGCTYGEWPSSTGTGREVHIFNRERCDRRNMLLDWEGNISKTTKGISTGHAVFGGDANNSGTFQNQEVVLAEPLRMCPPAPTPGAVEKISRDLEGKVVLIKRGTCTFVSKVKYAQDRGAIAAVVYNYIHYSTRQYVMGGFDRSITIPALFIGGSYGELLKRTINGSLTRVSLSCPVADPTCDIASADTRRQRVCACSCNGTSTFGLYFEAYDMRVYGKTRTGRYGVLADWEKNVHGDPWCDAMPFSLHSSLNQSLCPRLLSAEVCTGTTCIPIFRTQCSPGTSVTPATKASGQKSLASARQTSTSCDGAASIVLTGTCTLLALLLYSARAPCTYAAFARARMSVTGVHIQQPRSDLRRTILL